jgi:hypothetical protein
LKGSVEMKASIGLAAGVEEAASLILDHGFVERWVDGAIFPCEMAFFLAACRVRDVVAIVESGRQDGYSTQILGRFAERFGVDVYSIDLETDKERAQRCRDGLRGLPLHLLNGNAFDLIGRTVDALAGKRTALLLDGPKEWFALSTIAAAAAPHVEVCALHNMSEDKLAWFETYGACRYEDTVSSGGPAWLELCRREAVHRAGMVSGRPDTPSTLAVVCLGNEERARLGRCWKLKFGLHQPMIVRLFWRLRLYSLAPRLFDLSYRLLGT